MKNSIKIYSFLYLLINIVGCQSKNTSIESIEKSATDTTFSNETPFLEIAKFNDLYKKQVNQSSIENLNELRNFLKQSIEQNKIEYFTYSADTTFLPKTVESEDHKLKIYSYDNMLGGSMRYFDKIWMYNETDDLSRINAIFEWNEFEAKGMVYAIKMINKDRKTYYLVFGQNILSGRDIQNYVEAYEIVNNELSVSNLFQKDHKNIHKIEVSYDFFSVVERPERPIELIRYANDTLRVATVDDMGKVLDKNEFYIWRENQLDYEIIR